MMSMETNDIRPQRRQTISNQPPGPGRKRLLAMMIAASLPGAAAANVAGTVEFAHGNTMVVYANGDRESLSKGMTVSVNDTIRTGYRGLAQLRMTDGAYVSIDKNSAFRIDEYSYRPPAEEAQEESAEEQPQPANRGFFSLLAGGFRTITGFLGASNYEVKTPIATIGIRGTKYHAELGRSLSFSVDGGAIEVCNTAGCQFFRENEFGYIENRESLIRRLRDMGLDIVSSDEKGETVADLEGSDNFAFNVTDEVDDDGNLALLQRVGPDCSNGGCTAAFAFLFEGAFGVQGSEQISAEFDGDALIAHDGGAGWIPDAVGGAVAQAAGSTPDLAWGRWTGGLSEELYDVVHYMIGTPTPDINSLRGSVQYSVMGWTNPSYSSAAFASALGRFNGISGSLNADFTSSNVDLDFTAEFDNGDYNLQTVMPITSSGTFSTTSAVVTGGLPSLSSVVTCNVSCIAKVEGFFAGANARSAGLSYFIDDIDAGGGMIGTAAYESGQGSGVVSAK